MNIFATSWCPEESAQALDDQRLAKMVLESAQMLSVAANVVWRRTVEDGYYALTHQNHPCTLWTHASEVNYRWLIAHAKAIDAERIWRAAPRRVAKPHASMRVILLAEQEEWGAGRGWVEDFARCVPDFRHISDPTEAYRQQMICKWRQDKRSPRWTRRGPPPWAPEICVPRA